MNSAKRIFVAIGISEELQEKISNWEKNHADWPARWVRGENLHITLLPPWNERNVGAITDKLKTFEGEFSPFEFRFDKIEFGPDPRRPRLIWAIGGAPPEIIPLRNQISAALGIGIKHHLSLLHLTLARFPEENFQSFPVKNLNEKIDWRTEARSFSLMESFLLSSGAEYKTLREFNF